MRTIPTNTYKILMIILKKVFIIAAFIDGYIPSNIERELLSLPVKLGGIEIVIVSDITKTEYQD